MNAINWEALRKDFGPDQIQQIDKGFGPIDTINHALVTDRLNTVLKDDWSYTVDHEFAIDKSYWVKGTFYVAGVGRVEFGEGKDPKKAISDFIKRGAMRFGVGIHLWMKGDPEDVDGSTAAVSTSHRVVADAPTDSHEVGPSASSGAEGSTGEGIFGEGLTNPEGTSAPDAYIDRTTAGIVAAAFGNKNVALKAARAMFGDTILTLTSLTNAQAEQLYAQQVGEA